MIKIRESPETSEGEKMEEFDNNMTEFSPFTWQPVYSDGSAGELMDFSATIEQQNNLSTSRGILETIVEETSDDEDNHFSGKWSRNSDSFSSGSSETGSVVRVDVVQGEKIIILLSFRTNNQLLMVFFIFRTRQRCNVRTRFHLSAQTTTTRVYRTQ